MDHVLSPKVAGKCSRDVERNSWFSGAVRLGAPLTSTVPDCTALQPMLEASGV